MNKYFYIAVVVLSAIAAGCGSDKNPGYAYMPDMFYSRAYETYAGLKELKDAGINYDRMPVAGTVAQDEDLAFHFNLKNDSAGYAQSAFLKNPLDSAGAKVDLKEAERLYLVNCGICHGDKLDGNGPLFKGGDGPYTAAPKNFMADDMKAMTAGTMYFSITYGKGQMGSYASQISPKQRWEIVHFIKGKQGPTVAATATKVSATAKTEAK
ncbi:MAG TPA: cytochrome c [Niabella sp.]|nr:cytochrome c [Niabella sp.]HOZ95916.1 cytochrome c [Niabella sp.]HQW15828.1 cytochrome c [Niabella sp.]HQX20968.1 cytochrome c [Niabella sp.]HQX41242.1 cytochrome c [Niabella sp.]